MLLNIFSPQHILPILCLPCFKFFLFFNTNTLQDPSHKHACAILLFFLTNNFLENNISTYLVKFPWSYEFDALQFITLALLTTFTPHRLAASLFSVSCDLPSSNDIGLHTIGVLLTSNSWFSLLARCNLKTYLFFHIFGKLYSHSSHCIIYFIILFYISPMLTQIPLSVMFYAYHLHLCKTQSSPWRLYSFQ